ncbi:MAG: von Willebrand factor type A domain-containing protein [Verrucomicrobiales bacterium]
MKLPPPPPDGHPAPGEEDPAARVARLTALALGELSSAEASALEAEIWRDAGARLELEKIRNLAEELTFAYAAEPPASLTPAQHRAILERSQCLTGTDEKDARLTAYALGELRPAQAEVLSARLTDDRAATLELEAVGALAAKLRTAFAEEPVALLTLEQRHAIMEAGQKRQWESQELVVAPTPAARSTRRLTASRQRPPAAAAAAPALAPGPAVSRRWLRTAAIAAGFSAIGYLASTYDHRPTPTVRTLLPPAPPTQKSEFFPPLPPTGMADSPQLIALLDREKRRPAATVTQPTTPAEAQAAPATTATTTIVPPPSPDAGEAAPSPPRRQPDASVLPPPRQALAGAPGARSAPDASTVLHSPLVRPDSAPLAGFLATADVATATVPTDLGRAGYDVVRQCVRDFGILPPAELVRPEELVNQFDYDVKPAPGQDFAVAVEAAACPWNNSHHLVRVTVAARGAEIARPPLRLTLFLRLAESPESERAQLLVWQGLQALTTRLQPDDSVSMVVWGRAQGRVLPATSLAELDNLRDAPTRWHQGGAVLAPTDWATAEQALLAHATDNARNLCLIVTDGPLDFSGPPLDEATRRLRNMGAEVAVAELGPLRPESRAALLADRAATRYFRADSGPEAARLFAHEALASQVPVAEEADLQVVFNPSALAAWRPIGFTASNRPGHSATVLSSKAWTAGQQVTALYEVVPSSAPETWPPTAVFASPASAAQFSTSSQPPIEPAAPLSVRLRYRSPRSTAVQSITTDWTASAGAWRTASPNFRLATGAAAFALHLQNDPALTQLTLSRVSGWIRTAAESRDEFGLRREFADMVDAVERLKSSTALSE